MSKVTTAIDLLGYPVKDKVSGQTGVVTSIFIRLVWMRRGNRAAAGQ